MTKTSEAYGTRENWPPYTYRDYPGIKPETYEAFMKFLNTENTSGRLNGASTMGFRLRQQMCILLFPNYSLKQGAD